MKLVLFALVPGLLALGVLSLEVQAQDKIFKKDGTTLPREGGREITVTKETYTTVEYKLRGLGSSLGIPAKDVARIEYDRMPESYSTGLLSFRDQVYDQAIEDFKDAVKRGKGYHWVEQNALFNIATCYVKRGMYKEATSTFRTLLSNVPTTRFLPDAWLGIIKSTFHSQGTAGEKQILKAIQDFERVIKKNRLPGAFRHEVAYWKLRLQDAKREDISAEAEKLSRDAAEENPGVANKAKILIGLNLLGKDPNKARKFFEGVRRSAGDDQAGVKAAAYMGLGICIYRTSTEDKKDSYHIARDYLLRAITLGDKYPDKVEREIMVRALFFAGRCFYLLRKEKTESHNARYARDLYKEIRQNFRGTEWEKKAIDELKKM